jgi:hypothetical protein
MDIDTSLATDAGHLAIRTAVVLEAADGQSADRPGLLQLSLLFLKAACRRPPYPLADTAGCVTAVSVGTWTGGHCRSRPVDCTGTRPQPVADTTARQGDRRGHAADTTVVRAPAAEVPTGLCGSNAVRSAALVKGPARSAAVLWGVCPTAQSIVTFHRTHFLLPSRLPMISWRFTN